MTLLLDEGLSHRAAAVLRSRGFDALHVYDLALSGRSDEEVVRAARSQGRVIVTFDRHFHGILAREAATSPSVVHLRVEHIGYAEQADLIERVVRTHGEPLLAGAAVTVTVGQTRFRMLPLP